MRRTLLVVAGIAMMLATVVSTQQQQGGRPGPGEGMAPEWLFANVNFEDVGPGFGERAAKQLRADLDAGAVGLKIFKDLGLRITKTDGTRLKVDDPELGSIWEVCAERKVPVLLPDPILKKLYAENARTLVKGLPATALSSR